MFGYPEEVAELEKKLKALEEAMQEIKLLAQERVLSPDGQSFVARAPWAVAIIESLEAQ